MTKSSVSGDSRQKVALASDRYGPLSLDENSESLSVLNSLTDPVFVVGPDKAIVFVNQSAEQFLQSSKVVLVGSLLSTHFSEDSQIVHLVEQTQREESSVAEYGVRLETPRIGTHLVAVVISPMHDRPGFSVVTLQQQSIARKIDHQLVHRNAARSITAMGAMLAHEVKNPLSGIRGAAQLLELSAGEDDRQLTKLICDEADRIVTLVDRIEMFSDTRPMQREAVNIHEVLAHVRLLAETGFGQNVKFTEKYDPSLPEVYGNRDLLIQAFLNLIKNAVEALGKEGGDVTLTTSYQQGVRMRLQGGNERMDLPLLVTVEDNGPGISADLHEHLFDPFVTTKSGGKGLGLALVSKVVEEHGGVIELQSAPKSTKFSVSLPLVPKDLRNTKIKHTDSDLRDPS